MFFQFLSEELHSFPYLHDENTSLSSDFSLFTATGKVDDRKDRKNKKEAAPYQKIHTQKVSDLREDAGLRHCNKRRQLIKIRLKKTVQRIHDTFIAHTDRKRHDKSIRNISRPLRLSKKNKYGSAFAIEGKPDHYDLDTMVYVLLELDADRFAANKVGKKIYSDGLSAFVKRYLAHINRKDDKELEEIKKATQAVVDVRINTL
jgi:hypothetical protein